MPTIPSDRGETQGSRGYVTSHSLTTSYPSTSCVLHKGFGQVIKWRLKSSHILVVKLSRACLSPETGYQPCFAARTRAKLELV